MPALIRRKSFFFLDLETRKNLIIYFDPVAQSKSNRALPSKLGGLVLYEEGKTFSSLDQNSKLLETMNSKQRDVIGNSTNPDPEWKRERY